MRPAFALACCLTLALAACGPNPGSGGPLDASSMPGEDAQAGVAPDAAASQGADSSVAAGEDAAAAQPGPDAAAAGPDAAQAGPDAASAGADAALPLLTEQEPNDFKPATQYNPVTPPFEMTGTIQTGTYPDLDVLGATLAAGDLWTWRLEGPSGKVSPKLFIFEEAGDLPYFVSFAGPGLVVEQEQFVLASGLWHVVLADGRNPPDNNTVCGGADVCYGGADFDWRLTVLPTPRTPTAAAFPSTVQGTLRHPFAVDLYGFHAAANARIDIDLKAKRKSPPSDLESRLSLFDATNKLWRITNDGQPGTTDAHLSDPDGVLAEGEYVLVVENTDPAATDLSYQLDFKVLP